MSIPESVLAEVERKGKIMMRVFGTSAGIDALDLLRDMFDLDDCRGETTEDTYYKLGQRDVVKYIEALLRRVGDYE